MTNGPAGWNQDPYGRHELRYFDGTAWTENVSDAGVQGVDDPSGVGSGADATAEMESASPVEPAPVDASSPDASRGRPRRWPWIVGVVAALLVGIGIGGAATSSQDEVDSLNDELAVVTRERNAAEAKVEDRNEQRRTDLARVAAARVETEKAERRKEAAAAAKARKAAAAQKKAQAAAAAEAKRVADAQAAAAASAAAEAAKKDSFTGDGVRAVGVEINPGLWHTDGGVGSCYYAILNSTDTSDISDNNNTGGPASVTLTAGKYFETSGCAPWRRIG